MPLSRTIAASLIVALPGAGQAAERHPFVTSFERIRVEGPFRVTLATGQAPGATVSGDARAVDGVEVQVTGSTLVVRAAAGRRAEAAPATIALTTQAVSGAAVVGGGTLTIAGARANRLDLSVAGAGTIAVFGAATAQASAMVVGTGEITLAGRGDIARLVVNGAGRIAADAFEAGALTVLVDGPGEVAARARLTASVGNSGLGRVTVAGNPLCTVRNPAGGAVSCGME